MTILEFYILFTPTFESQSSIFCRDKRINYILFTFDQIILVIFDFEPILASEKCEKNHLLQFTFIDCIHFFNKKISNVC